MPIVACVQLNGSSDVEKNLRSTEALVERAARAGAELVATPEATTFLGPHDRKVALAEPIDGPTNARLARLAARLGITLLVGSVAEACDARRAYNTSLLFGPKGERLATYRKLHLFDVDIDGGVRFLESDRTAAGADVVVADTSVGKLGLSICFDVRFPELYRALADRGAEILAVPSAFTLMTGKDHWHVLLRARAIETQCWLLAPAQWGAHDDQDPGAAPGSGREKQGALRRSYGHSLIVDPWGVVVAECGDGEGICLAEIDREKVLSVRRQIPMDANRRLATQERER
jgi:predicted amidohydrolase